MEVIKMKWTDAGSVAEFQEFFQARDKTGLVLDEICTVLGHNVAEHDAQGLHCFLDAGATGKVFQVELRI